MMSIEQTDALYNANAQFEYCSLLTIDPMHYNLQLHEHTKLKTIDCNFIATFVLRITMQTATGRAKNYPQSVGMCETDFFISVRFGFGF